MLIKDIINSSEESDGSHKKVVNYIIVNSWDTKQFIVIINLDKAIQMPSLQLTNGDGAVSFNQYIL